MKIGTRVRAYEAWGHDGPQWRDSIIGTVIERVICPDDTESTLHYVVRWDNGKLENTMSIEDVTPCLFVNVYLHDRAYGGGEEGGWWYDTYAPEEEQCCVFNTEDEAEAHVEVAQAWCDEENACRRSDISSVLSEGRYVVRLEAFPAEHIPERRPHYC